MPAASSKESTQKKTSAGYIEIPIPKVSVKNYNPNTLNLLLFAVLIVGAFFLGMLTTKVQYLEKGVTTAATQPNQAQVAGTQQQPQEPAPVDAKVAAEIVKTNDSPLPILGTENAKVTVVEFSDFQCPFCKQYFDDAFPEIKKEYIDTGKISYAFRHYPLTFHQNAQKAGEAAECVNEQGKFWEYHDLLFSNQTTWETLSADDAAAKFAEYATKVGADGSTVGGCLSSDKYAQKVKADMDTGIKAGVSGTPTIFINGKRLVGAQPYSAFKTAIDEALNE